MAKQRNSSPPLQEELFPPLTARDAHNELLLQIQELKVVISRMEKTAIQLEAFYDLDFHVQFVEQKSFYSGVLLSSRL